MFGRDFVHTLWRFLAEVETGGCSKAQPPVTTSATGGVNYSVLVAKQPIAPATLTCRAAATECIIGEYMINDDYTELITFLFRR